MGSLLTLWTLMHEMFLIPFLTIVISLIFFCSFEYLIFIQQFCFQGHLPGGFGLKIEIICMSHVFVCNICSFFSKHPEK